MFAGREDVVLQIASCSFPAWFRHGTLAEAA